MKHKDFKILFTVLLVLICYAVGNISFSYYPVDEFMTMGANGFTLNINFLPLLILGPWAIYLLVDQFKKN